MTYAPGPGDSATWGPPTGHPGDPRTDDARCPECDETITEPSCPECDWYAPEPDYEPDPWRYDE